MPAEILTTDDLREFKVEIISEIKQLFSTQPANVQVEKRFLKSAELQELLGMSPASLQNLRNARVLPYTKIGGTFYYDWEEIVQLMAKLKKPAKPKFS
ncbi:MAG: helix-turn-helix domain-containing protein [Saprospiraceae bacterium]|nr:helix-turn-helix domain-containing protein [Saprospiraceae bacterium]